MVRRAAVDLLLSAAGAARVASAGRGRRAGGADPGHHRRRAGRRLAHDHGADPSGDRPAGEPQEDAPHPEAERLAGLVCGRDGWCHLTAIIDCYDRTIVGWRLATSGIAGGAAAALEEALRARRIDAASPPLVLRSDNGVVFGAKAFVAVARRYGLTQEYSTPYTPQPNGLIERFFLTLKQECVWLHRFTSRDHAFTAVADWLDKYARERPHSALGYRTPKAYREQLVA
ncbi:MAG: transposase family protein [bacterium]|nr:transposase family protein [bacterium]